MQRSLELIKTVYEISQLEEFGTPEIALAGRSNVGKSSLINCLGGRKKLAKISSTPGKTRSLNYYKVHPDGFHLVDLPGYGYARCSKTERQKWAKLIDRYLTTSNHLRAVAILLDSRHKPQQNDIDLAHYVIDLNIPLIPILTKADKSKQKDRAVIQKLWKEELNFPFLPPCVSSKTGQGRDKLWEIIAKQAMAD
ncbi:MAG: ribosome biogenesis GTP-binding protein YihA/YsxC [Desulfovibrio sp.]